MLREEWLSELSVELEELLPRPDVPLLDIEWLLERSRDTQRYAGQFRSASIEQLAKDVAAFDAEFPGMLSKKLVVGATRREENGI